LEFGEGLEKGEVHRWIPWAGATVSGPRPVGMLVRMQIRCPDSCAVDELPLKPVATAGPALRHP
jgi:hypothetical protein